MSRGTAYSESKSCLTWSDLEMMVPTWHHWEGRRRKLPMLLPSNTAMSIFPGTCWKHHVPSASWISTSCSFFPTSLMKTSETLKLNFPLFQAAHHSHAYLGIMSFENFSAYGSTPRTTSADGMVGGAGNTGTPLVVHRAVSTVDGSLTTHDCTCS